jgi:ribosomal protein S27E
MKIGARAGTNNELTVINMDSLGRRATVRCNACARVFVVAASAAVGARCICCAPPTAERLAELRSEAHDLDLRRQLREWRRLGR